MYAEDLAQTYTGSMIVSLVSVSPYEHNLVVSVACGTVVSLTPPSDPYNHSSHRPQDCPSSPSNLARDLCICSNQLLNKPSMIMIAQCSCLWVSHIMIRNHFSNTFALSFFFFFEFCLFLSFSVSSPVWIHTRSLIYPTSVFWPFRQCKVLCHIYTSIDHKQDKL